MQYDYNGCMAKLLPTVNFNFSSQIWQSNMNLHFLYSFQYNPLFQQFHFPIRLKIFEKRTDSMEKYEFLLILFIFLHTNSRFFIWFEIHRTNSIRVYNCTSGQINPLMWEACRLSVLNHSRTYPSKYVMMYPNCKYRTNRFVHRLYEIFLHFLPAYLFDCYMKWQGSKPVMFNIAKRYKAAADTGNCFFLSFHSIRELSDLIFNTLIFFPVLLNEMAKANFLPCTNGNSKCRTFMNWWMKFRKPAIATNSNVM